MLLTHALALPESQLVHKQKYHEFTHSRGFELTKLTEIYKPRGYPDTPGLYSKKAKLSGCKIEGFVGNPSLQARCDTIDACYDRGSDFRLNRFLICGGSLTENPQRQAFFWACGSCCVPTQWDCFSETSSFDFTPHQLLGECLSSQVEKPEKECSISLA